MIAVAVCSWQSPKIFYTISKALIYAYVVNLISEYVSWTVPSIESPLMVVESGVKDVHGMRSTPFNKSFTLFVSSLIYTQVFFYKSLYEIRPSTDYLAGDVSLHKP